MHTLKYILKSQYLTSNNLNEGPSLRRYVEGFKCVLQDDYCIEGEMGMPLPPFVAKFSQSLLHGNLLGVADEDGRVRLLDSRKTKTTATIKEWSAHSNAVFDLAWVNDEPKMITASGDQTARLWDINKAETIAIFRGHTCSLKSVSIQPQSNRVFITGARDGNVLLWDTRCYMRNGFCNPMNTIRNAHVLPPNESVTWSAKKKRTRRASMFKADSKQSVTAVIFQDNNTIISSGACDGMLKFWDIRKNYTIEKGIPTAFHTIANPEKAARKYGYSSLVLDSTKSRLFAVCTNDVIYEYGTSLLPRLPLRAYRGHSVSSFYVKAALSPDDRFLLCGSSDNNAYIWTCGDTKSSPWLLKGHESEVTSVTWSPHDGEKIVTCSDDNMFKIWRLFQKNRNDSVITGTCEKSVDDDNGGDSKSINDHTDTKGLRGHAPKVTSSYKPFDLCTHPRITRSWSVNEFQRTLASSAASQQKKINQAFTNVASKMNTTNQDIIKTPKIAKIKSYSTSSSPDSLFTFTPKSSRAFMETWLKSPRTPPPTFEPKHLDINKRNCLSCDRISTKTNDPNDKQLKTGESVKCNIKSTSRKSDVISPITTDRNDVQNKRVRTEHAKNNKVRFKDLSKSNKDTLTFGKGILLIQSSSEQKANCKGKLRNIQNMQNIRLSFNKAGKRARSLSFDITKNSRSSKIQKRDKENDFIYVDDSVDDVFENPVDNTRRVFDLLDHADGVTE